MASLHLSVWRRFALASLRLPRLQPPAFQRRWAQVHDVRFLTTPPSQAVLEKYRAKLDQKAKAEGHASIESLKAAYADAIVAQRQRDAVVASPSPAAPAAQSSSIPQAPNTPVSQPNRHKPAEPSAAAGVRTLDEILDLVKVRALPEKEITALWRLRYADNPSALCAVIPAATYFAMDAVARRAPQFVLPVPHDAAGAEMHYLQWLFDHTASTKTTTVLFTQLAEYKARADFARPHTTITHHLDLAADKGLVLMQGQVVDDDRGVGAVKLEHARWLVMCLQRFYGAWESDAGGSELQGERKERAQARKQLLEWFAAGDARFSVEKLLQEAERMG